MVPTKKASVAGGLRSLAGSHLVANSEANDIAALDVTISYMSDLIETPIDLNQLVETTSRKIREKQEHNRLVDAAAESRPTSLEGPELLATLLGRESR